MTDHETDENIERMRDLARHTSDDAQDIDSNGPTLFPVDPTQRFAVNQANLNQAMVGTFVAINGRLQSMAGDVEEVKGRQQDMAGDVEEVKDRQQDMAQDMDQRFSKIDAHLRYLRGGHAANVVQRDASLIADDMGYQIVTQLRREEMIAFANMARSAGKAEDDVRSFRAADLVMLARDAEGHPAYIAVEASFTVGSNDIRRAKRNAEYLREFTGLPAKGAVAGVEIASGREQNANADGVYCYHIPVRDLEAD